MTNTYPRDMSGYGAEPPDPAWPGGARVALQIVLNYEEGSENNILHGDAASEPFLSEIVGAPALEGARHLTVESTYEYGSRAGFWRLMRAFEDRRIPITIFAVAMALERNPAAAAMVEAGHEISSHGWRWIDYQFIDEETEREHVHRAVASIERLAGKRPEGWYTGRVGPNTRRLVAQESGCIYDADSYADDLPYWVDVEDRPWLIVPYTLDANDMRFAVTQGFNSGDQFFANLRDTFDVLYAEGAESPKMMSVGLHCRLVGRPGRFAAFQRFLDYVQSHDEVWICRRVDIARHWYETHPPPRG